MGPFEKKTKALIRKIEGADVEATNIGNRYEVVCAAPRGHRWEGLDVHQTVASVFKSGPDYREIAWSLAWADVKDGAVPCEIEGCIECRDELL